MRDDSPPPLVFLPAPPAETDTPPSRWRETEWDDWLQRLGINYTTVYQGRKEDEDGWLCDHWRVVFGYRTVAGRLCVFDTPYRVGTAMNRTPPSAYRVLDSLMADFNYVDDREGWLETYAEDEQEKGEARYDLMLTLHDAFWTFWNEVQHETTDDIRELFDEAALG